MMAIIWQSEFLAHPAMCFAGDHSSKNLLASCFIWRVLAVRLALKANTLAWYWANPWIRGFPKKIEGNAAAKSPESPESPGPGIDS